MSVIKFVPRNAAEFSIGTAAHTPMDIDATVHYRRM